MSVVWKLEYNGEIRPLAQWGIEAPVLDLSNQVTDTFKFQVTGESDTAAPLFAFGAKVILWRDSVRWFHGWITTLPWAGAATSDRQQYVASGPWYWLEKTIYQQPAWVLRDPDQPALAYAVINVGKLVLFQSATGEKSNAGAMAQDVVDYAIFKATQFNAGAPLFSRGTFTDLTAADAPWERGLDLSCAEALRRCTRWLRDAVAYWDYTGEVPVLQIKRRANLTPAELDLADADRIGEYSLTPREDLVPRGVLIRYERTRTQENGNQWTEYVEDKAGTADGGPGCISATLTLAGSGDGAEPVPSGLAAAYYSSLSTMPWEGSVRLLEADPTGVATVGNVLNLLSGRTAWETMAAVIQRVTITLDKGETIIDFGPADQLGPQDFLDQVRFQRGDSAGNSASTRFDGRAPSGPDGTQKPGDAPPAPPSGPPGGSGGPQPGGHYIKVCEDGHEKTIFISG